MKNVKNLKTWGPDAMFPNPNEHNEGAVPPMPQREKTNGR